MTAVTDNNNKFNTTIQQIVTHYDNVDLLTSVGKVIQAAQLSNLELSDEEIGIFDELHVGGREATLKLAELAQLPEGSLVLDIGSGLGGPARILNRNHGLKCVGIDLVEGYCKVAKILNHLSGLKQNSVYFVNGNALNLPVKSNQFDAVWSQHCSMNIEDKKTLYDELFRVLKTKGKLLIHDITSGSSQNVLYPVPWASSEESSFLLAWNEVKTILEYAGFICRTERNITDEAFAWYDKQKERAKTQKPGRLNQSMVFGARMREMVRNLKQNLKEDRARIMEAVFYKA